MTKPSQKFERVALVASDNPEAQAALARLTHSYGTYNGDTPDAVVALGGDGLMLQTLHRYMHRNIPIYGMNRGSVGFLMNEYREDALFERLAAAETAITHPLTMTATDAEGRTHRALAINEVSMFRQTHQAAKLRISVDDKVRLEELICDGVLVATPAGSTAYNLSAYGPILPIDTALLALTPISPFRPRRWRGALLTNRARIVVEVLEADKRAVSAVADHTETRSVTRVQIEEDASVDLIMLFDPGHSLDERILSEQFRY
jgi:NAD+ kinase